MNDRDLIIKTAALARIAPGAWQEFLGAFANYTEQQRSNCVLSPIETLPVAQGRAQACTHLLAFFRDCMAIADKAEGKRK